MKKIISLLGALALSFALFANDATKTFTKFLNATYSRDFETAYSMISSEDKEENDLEDFQRFVINQMDVYYYAIDLIKDNMNIKYVYEENEEDEYYGEYEITTLDNNDEEVSYEALEIAFTTDDDNEGIKIMNNYMKDKNVTLKTYEKYFTLLKEDGVWKVVLEDVDLF